MIEWKKQKNFPTLPDVSVMVENDLLASGKRKLLVSRCLQLREEFSRLCCKFIRFSTTFKTLVMNQSLEKDEEVFYLLVSC